MENEKHFYPEHREMEPKSYEIQFDDEHFGDSQGPIDTNALVSAMHTWWEKICTENSIDPDDKVFGKVHYHLMELGKNALEYANGGKIKVIFELAKIIVVVTDEKGWDGDPNDDILYGSPGHGLSEVKRYADEFFIETNGLRYTKVPKNKKLVVTDDTDVQQGSKITFIKNFE